jgi:hypothetical protein
LEVFDVEISSHQGILHRVLSVFAVPSDALRDLKQSWPKSFADRLKDYCIATLRVSQLPRLGSLIPRMSTHTALLRRFPALLGLLLLWCATSVAQGGHPLPNDTGAKMTLKERLARFITSPPDVVQFAKDKKYEEAWIIKSSSAKPSADDWKRYIDREKFDVLIVQYVWNLEDNDNRFVLTLFQDKRVKMRNPEEFVKTCLDLFSSKPDFLTLMNTLDGEVIGKPYLLQNRADEATIGIFNYWFSIGPGRPLEKGR